MLTTHIGSLPFNSIEDALDFNSRCSLPVISTLPKVDSSEYFLDQFVSLFEGLEIIDNKIYTKANIVRSNNGFSFLIEHDFSLRFQNQDVKIQFPSFGSIICSFDSMPDDETIIYLLEEYNLAISDYLTKIEKSYKSIIVFVDCPYYTNSLGRKFTDLQLLNNSRLEGLHCCNDISLLSSIHSSIQFFSFDTTFCNKELLKNLRMKKVTILAGIWNTTDLSVIDDIKADYYTPSCGLVFTDADMIKGFNFKI